MRAKHPILLILAIVLGGVALDLGLEALTHHWGQGPSWWQRAVMPLPVVWGVMWVLSGYWRPVPQPRKSAEPAR